MWYYVVCITVKKDAMYWMNTQYVADGCFRIIKCTAAKTKGCKRIEVIQPKNDEIFTIWRT